MRSGYHLRSRFDSPGRSQTSPNKVGQVRELGRELVEQQGLFIAGECELTGLEILSAPDFVTVNSSMPLVRSRYGRGGEENGARW